MTEENSEKRPITRLLRAVSQGDGDAKEKLFELVYEDLRAISQKHFRGQPPEHTLQPTAVLHEAYIRMMRNENEADWIDRSHFFATAARAIRHILIDYARRWAVRSKGKRVDLDVSALEGKDELPSLDLLAVHEALDRIAEKNPLGARIAEARLFAQLEFKDIAEAVDLSERSVRRAWSEVREFLRRELQKGTNET